MIDTEHRKHWVEQATWFRVAPPVRPRPDDTDGYCDHCDHCQDNIIAICGACGDELTPNPTKHQPWWDETYDACVDCGLNYETDQAEYLDPKAYACLTPKDSTVSFGSRLGWCYLPTGHKSDHYYLSKRDIES